MPKKLTLFSDFICPYCYIAEQTTLPALRREHPDVEFEWVGFELHPETPPEGVALEDSFGEETSKKMRAHCMKLAADFGLGELKAPDVMVNTMAAHALCEYARDHGKLSEVRRAIMDALWIQSMNIGAESVLAAIAEECGLDGTEAVEAAFDHEYRLRVIQNRARGYEQGVTGIPTFRLGDKQVVGCKAIAQVETDLFDS